MSNNKPMAIMELEESHHLMDNNLVKERSHRKNNNSNHNKIPVTSCLRKWYKVMLKYIREESQRIKVKWEWEMVLVIVIEAPHNNSRTFKCCHLLILLIITLMLIIDSIALRWWNNSSRINKWIIHLVLQLIIKIL